MEKKKVVDKQTIFRVKKDLITLRRSSFYGYWLRLKSLHFKFRGNKITSVTKNNVTYICNTWRFVYNNEIILLKSSRLSQKLIIKHDKKIVLKLITSSGSYEIEEAFLKYIDQKNKPLFIRRMGRRNKVVKEWEKKWLQHIKNNGKWTKKLRDMRVFDYAIAMPTQNNVKPRRK